MNITRSIVCCGCLAVILSTLASAQVMKFDDNNIELDPGSVVIIDPVSGNIEVSSAHGDLECSNPGGGGAGGRVLKLDGNTIELAPGSAVTVDPVSGNIEVVSESGDWVCGDGDDGLEGDELAISGLQATPNPADAGDFIAFSYSTNGADFCQATGNLPGWTGQKPLNSTSSTGVQTTSSTPSGTYSAGLQCMTNAGDSTAQSIEVTVQGGATVENPTISGFSASPNPATQGQSIVFNYSTTNAATCQATGNLPGWSGSKPTQGPSSGVSTSSTSPATYTAGLRCENTAGNSTSQSISVTVRSGGTLAISGLSASPNPATQGDFIAISYSTSGADFCRATGNLPGWLGEKLLNSTSTTGVQTTATTPPGEYSAGLECMTNAGDHVEEIISVTLEGDGGPPGISGFSASPNPVTQGNNVSIDYSTFNADSCEASGTLPGWSGSKPTQGPVAVSTDGTAADDYEATLVCSNAEGSTSQTIEVTVQPPGAPTISGFKATPNPVTQGDDIRFDYTTSNAETCQATGNLPGWDGPKILQGPVTVSTGSISAGSFSAGLQCFNADGDSTSSSISVTVQEPSDGDGTGDCAAHPPPAGTSRDTSILRDSSATTTLTFASVYDAFPGLGISQTFWIRSNRYAALSFNTGALASGVGGRVRFQEIHTVDLGPLAVTISRCPGDLGPQPDPRCRSLRNPETGAGRDFFWRIDEPDSTNSNNSTNNRCPLEPGTDYYLNIMPATSIPDTGSPVWNCESGTRCGARGSARLWE